LAWRESGLWLEITTGCPLNWSTGTEIERHAPDDPSAESYQAARTPARALAIEAALSSGCSDAAAIRHLVQTADLVRAQGALVEVGALARFERPFRC
jgi:hypothetical protein